MFHDIYQTSGGSADELHWLASTYKFNNPGPIVAYPPNSHLFRSNTSPAVLPGNVELLIPWHPGQLARTVTFHDKLAQEYAKHAVRLLEAQGALRSQIDSQLVMIDSIAVATTTLVQLGTLAARGFDVDTPARLLQDGERWAYLLADRSLAATGAPSLAIPSPAPPSQFSFGFVMRHALGAWSPSFWASVYVAASEHDMGAWLFGTAAIDHRNRMSIKQDFERDIARLTRTANDAKQQLLDQFYDYRV